MSDKMTTLIVESYLDDGRLFRPTDWMERLASAVAGFGPDQRLRYSNSVRPRVIDGHKYLVVNRTLKYDDPAAYEYVIDFVKSNGLRCYESMWREM